MEESITFKYDVCNQTYITFGKIWSKTCSARLEFQPQYPRKNMSAFKSYKFKISLFLILIGHENVH